MKDPSPATRIDFLRATGLGLAAAAAAPGAALAAGGGGPARATESPDEAIKLLKAGNARFVAGTPQCLPATARRAALAQGQKPFAMVLGCADSRVAPETLFDVDPGHIFSVRVAGNFFDENGLGSMEYGSAVLGAPLLVVMGHTKCGAVDATVGFVKSGTSQPGHIQGLLTAIEPAVKATQGQTDWLHAAIVENAKMNAAGATEHSDILAQAVHGGKLKIVAAVYDLASGKVNFL